MRGYRTWIIGVIVGGFACAGLAGQPPRQLKTHRNIEEFCLEQPAAISCRNRNKVISPKSLGLAPPFTGMSPSRPLSSTRVVPPTAEPSIIRLGEIDWRFAHPSSAMLAGIHVDRILQSSFVRSLISQFTGGASAADV